jgi:hypothetical protein
MAQVQGADDDSEAPVLIFFFFGFANASSSESTCFQASSFCMLMATLRTRAALHSLQSLECLDAAADPNAGPEAAEPDLCEVGLQVRTCAHTSQEPHVTKRHVLHVAQFITKRLSDLDSAP